jgi:hypothetical protein
MILTRDETFKVVFNLRTQRPIGGESVGTGIFVVNGNDIFLLTATHVARDTNRNTTVVISDALGNATSIALVRFNNALAWKHHPVADISALPIAITPDIEALVKGRFLPFDHFHTQRTHISRDIELTCVGFPHGLGATGMFSPLTYRSFVSSALVSLNRFDTGAPCEFFLLENPSVGGYSGGPIFDLGVMIVGSMTITKDATRCLGLMHGTISDQTGGKLAAVTPAYYLQGFI